MKAVIVIMGVMVLLAFGVSGCQEEAFVGGFASGAAAMKKMADDAQNKFIETVNELNDETNRLNAEIGAVQDIDVDTFIKPETIAAIDSLKDKQKDPMTWVALASVLGAAFFGGKVHEKKKVAQ